MDEIERARRLLEREFKRLNDRLESSDNKGAGEAIEGKFGVKAYIERLAQINDAMRELRAYSEEKIDGGSKEAERGCDAAA